MSLSPYEPEEPKDPFDLSAAILFILALAIVAALTYISRGAP